MRTREITSDAAVLELDLEECRVVKTVLNEVCHGLRIPEFSATMGTDRPYVTDLLGQFHDLCVRIRNEYDRSGG